MVQASLENEAALLTAIVAWLQSKKTEGALDSATVTTDEVSVPQVITV